MAKLKKNSKFDSAKQSKGFVINPKVASKIARSFLSVKANEFISTAPRKSIGSLLTFPPNICREKGARDEAAWLIVKLLDTSTLVDAEHWTWNDPVLNEIRAMRESLHQLKSHMPELITEWRKTKFEPLERGARKTSPASIKKLENLTKNLPKQVLQWDMQLDFWMMLIRSNQKRMTKTIPPTPKKVEGVVAEILYQVCLELVYTSLQIEKPKRHEKNQVIARLNRFIYK